MSTREEDGVHDWDETETSAFSYSEEPPPAEDATSSDYEFTSDLVNS